MSDRRDWPEREADLLQRDVTRADLVACGCITPRRKLREAIEAGIDITKHPDAPWMGEAN